MTVLEGVRVEVQVEEHAAAAAAVAAAGVAVGLGYGDEDEVGCSGELDAILTEVLQVQAYLFLRSLLPGSYTKGRVCPSRTQVVAAACRDQAQGATELSHRACQPCLACQALAENCPAW